VRATEVRYRPSSKDKATVLRSYLGGVGKLIEDDSVTEVDVDIVLGKDFKGVTTPAGAAPAASAAPAPPPAPPPSGGANGEPGGPAVDPTQCA
jgi:hypothetical protein